MESNGRVSKKAKFPSSYITESEIRQEFSHHKPGVARINNGSFGSCPASIISAKQKWELQFLQQPDEFYFNELRSSILESRTAIKKIINADDVSEVSLVDNATTAVAIVLQQIGRGFGEGGKFSKGDAVVILECAYEAVKKSIQAYVIRAGGTVIEVQLPFPFNSKEEVMAEFRKGLKKAKVNGRKVRLAMIDHITSMPSVVVPVAELVKICREESVDQVFVDAAHAIGSVKVDVKEIGADFYVSNLHKWFFCPPSVSFLYCRRTSISSNELHHPVVSHEYGNGLAIESSWIGMRDYSSQLVVASVMEFVDRFEGGMEGIMKRNHEGVVKMGEMLAKCWGTNLGSPPHMCASMIMVGLPSKLRIENEGDAFRLRSHLRTHYGIEVPIYCCHGAGCGPRPRDEDGFITGYARISHQVYNTFQDYSKLGDAVNQLVKEGSCCDMLSSD